MKKQFTPENIDELPENSIFVFGSNMNGNHAGGAARTAVEKFGAIEGQSDGLQGQSYAIPTLSKKMQKLSITTITKSVKKLAEFAKENSDKTFYVTKIGCGIAGFDEVEIAEVFKNIPFGDNVILPESFSHIVVAGFKGFNKDLQCTPGGKVFRYEIGKTYEEPNADLCSTGFHFCESPLSVLNYYPLKDGNRYAKVDGEYVSDRTEGDTKRVSKKITIKEEVGVGGLIKSSIDWVFEKIKQSKVSATSGDSANSATSGDYAHSATSGNYAHSATSGYSAHSATSGKYANSATSGDSAHSATSGKYANSATSGDCSRSAVKDTAIAASVGINGKAKGMKGCWIVVAEWKKKGDGWEIAGVKSAEVDGEIIKEDTYYKLENGDFAECN